MNVRVILAICLIVLGIQAEDQGDWVDVFNLPF